ncbi:MAG TPA: hypothetical protein VLX44_22025 [Xanthobacteraceae bacterium]|nr:hypothetical protein [Xanthobacteraceae bacterium]
MRAFDTIRACASAVGVGLALTLLAGCAGDMFGSKPETTASTSSSGSSLSDKFNALLSGTPTMSAPPATTAAAGGNPTPADIDCPGVEIRQGASTFQQSGPDNGSAALSLRFQANFVRSARSCALRAGNVAMKVGVEGRLILGPAGTPGTFTLPVRLALVKEGIEPKTIWTKFYEVPVTVAPGESNIPFTHVEEDMSFPMPPGNELDTYVIYVGFDPEGATPEPKRKPAKPKAKR